MRFRDRRDAGRKLAALLAARAWQDPVVLALPRGGVPVGYEVAVALRAPFDVFVARKVGAPGNPEYGIGAIAEGGTRVMNRRVDPLAVSAEEFRQLAADEAKELARRVEEYRGGRELLPLAGRDVIVVDDGLATGVTAEAAVRAIRTHGPARVVMAAPVGSEDGHGLLQEAADEVVVLLEPQDFAAVGQWYDEFKPTTDDEVARLLAQAGTARR